MKQVEAHLYRSDTYDGTLYVKVKGVRDDQRCQISLLKDGRETTATEGDKALFAGNDGGRYRANVTVFDENGTAHVVSSREVTVAAPVDVLKTRAATSADDVKEVRRPYDGVRNYTLNVRLKDGRDHHSLKQAITAQADILGTSMAESSFLKIGTNKYLGDILPGAYRLDHTLDFDQAVKVAETLEALDLVRYCSIAPDLGDLAPPDLPPVSRNTAAPAREAGSDAMTPDLEYEQFYLAEHRPTQSGMNVRKAWAQGETGSLATSRHQDFGINPDHEDLLHVKMPDGNTRWDGVNTHGTQSVGVITARKNGFGMTGIAHGADFYAYGYEQPLVNDAFPGDIVSVDVAFTVNGKMFPMIISRVWWDLCKSLTDRNVTLIMAAGNSGLNLSTDPGMPDYGDCGVILIGASRPVGFGRLGFSNYNHPNLVLNSWGEYVASTGEGNLYCEEGTRNRDYTNTYSGTSSATPLCNGALTLIQSYAIRKLGVMFTPRGMIDLIKKTGYDHSLHDQIGYMPNVFGAMERIDAMAAE